MDGWKVVRTVGTEEDASLIAGFLQSRGVVANIESLLFHQAPVSIGGPEEVRVLVPEAEEARALALLGKLSEAGEELAEGAEPPAGEGEEKPE